MCFGSHNEEVCRLLLSSLQVCISFSNLLNLNFDHSSIWFPTYLGLCVWSVAYFVRKRALESGEDASRFCLAMCLDFFCGNLNIEDWYLSLLGL